MTQPKTLTVTATHAIPVERVKDLLVSAFEGGSNYWYLIESDLTGKHPADIVTEGGKLIISSTEDAVFKGRGNWTLDLAACERALQMMAQGKWTKSDSFQKPLRFWADFLDENDDAETADIFLQLALFGEVVYG